MSKFYANTNMLLGNYVKCYIFKTYCCNFYCTTFPYNSIKTAMENLKIGYSKSARRPLGLSSHNSARGMFENFNIFFWGGGELLRKSVYSFRNRLEISDNIFIRGIYWSHFYLQSGIWAWLRDISWRNYNIVLGIIPFYYFLSIYIMLIYIISTSSMEIFIRTVFRK